MNYPLDRYSLFAVMLINISRSSCDNILIKKGLREKLFIIAIWMRKNITHFGCDRNVDKMWLNLLAEAWNAMNLFYAFCAGKKKSLTYFIEFFSEVGAKILKNCEPIFLTLFNFARYQFTLSLISLVIHEFINYLTIQNSDKKWWCYSGLPNLFWFWINWFN